MLLVSWQSTHSAKGQVAVLPGLKVSSQTRTMRPGKATRRKKIMGCSKRLDLRSLASRTAIQQSQSKILVTLEPPNMKDKNVQGGGGGAFDVIRFVLGNSCDVI